jgi:hypothetical protein
MPVFKYLKLLTSFRLSGFLLILVVYVSLYPRYSSSPPTEGDSCIIVTSRFVIVSRDVGVGVY